MDIKCATELPALEFLHYYAVVHPLFEECEIGPQAADGRSHRTQCNAVGAAILKAFQLCHERLHLFADTPGALSVFGRRCSGEQGRRGCDDTLSLSRYFLRRQRSRNPPRGDAVENVADLAEGVNRNSCTDNRQAADPEEGEQQSARYAEFGGTSKCGRSGRLVDLTSQGLSLSARKRGCQPPYGKGNARALR